MKRIVLGFCTLTVAAWLLNFWISPPAMQTKTLVHEVFYLNGVLAWGLMAIAIVIAARPAWLEKVTGTPLDELYKWHKTLGVWAAVLTLWHFFTKALTVPVLSLFSLEKAPQVVRGELVGWDAFWSWLRGFAVTSSEWATLIGLVLFVVSFVSVVRYHKWLLSHKLFSVIFIVLAVHSIRLMDAADYLTPFGWINIAVTVVGCVYAVQLLTRGAGSAKTVAARISKVESGNGLTLLTVNPEKDLHVDNGEFMFLCTKGHEKHPFSVACVHDDGALTFAVKGLGDYTGSAVPQLKEGEAVVLEGPWGRFTPDFSEKKQLWFAGGVGIAPFCAWLQKAPENICGGIRLVWCIRSGKNEPLFDEIQRLAGRAGVKLEVYESTKARLNVDGLFADGAPDSVSVCAGQKLAAAVKIAYARAGGSLANVRQEHFNWR